MNNKSYIGKTIYGLEIRKKQHLNAVEKYKSYFYRGIRKYGKDSFQPIKTPHEGEEFLLKPMNCPAHCEI